mgnify:CR=1 FL=1
MMRHRKGRVHCKVVEVTKRGGKPIYLSVYNKYPKAMRAIVASNAKAKSKGES